MQHKCQTCKNDILCECEDFCDICNGSTKIRVGVKRKITDVRAATVVTTAGTIEKSEPNTKKRAVVDGDDKDE